MGAQTIDGDDKDKRALKKERKQERAEAQPKKTNLGDSATIKRIMDDAVIQVLLDDSEEGLGYVEDTALSNLKLVVGFAGVGASLVSHVYPAPFPKNWLVLLLCCAWYFLMSGILQLILSFCELESILLVRETTDASHVARAEGLNFSSHLPRFQEMYTLGITPLPKGSLGLASAPKFRPMPPSTTVKTSADGSQKQWPVNHFFDEDGTFAEDAFINDVRAFVKAFESKKTR